MRIGNDNRGDEFEINVIPLIDVLLTLLMFFVLTTTFVRHASMQVTLPTASAHESATPDNPLIVMIDSKGHYYVGSNQVLGEGEDALKRAIAAAAGTDHDRPVSLRADAASSHQSVVTAMDVLGQLGFSRLSIGTTRTETAADQ